MSICTPVTSPSLDKSSLTFLTSHNLNIFAPALFQLVVTNLSLSRKANLALWKASLIWCFKIILLALGSKIFINLFLVVAPIKVPLGLHDTKVGVSSAFSSQNVSPLITFQTWSSPRKAPEQTTSAATGLKVTKGTFLVCFW